MAERRQASRREPIEVEVRGEVFFARPLPWQKGNDLGNEIIRQNVRNINESVRLYVEDNIPQLDMALGVKIDDWNSVLLLAYPDTTSEKWNELQLELDEASDLVLASLEVNHLEHLKHLVDPNSLAPATTGGNETLPGEMEIGQKIESLLSSSSEESSETPSSISPEESLTSS